MATSRLLNAALQPGRALPDAGRCARTGVGGSPNGRRLEGLMEFRVLGPLEVRDGDESLPLAGAKPRGLLALLLVHANHVVSRDRLIDELWGEKPPETAVESVHNYVSRLRKLLPPQTLLTRAPGYLLEIDPDTLDL